MVSFHLTPFVQIEAVKVHSKKYLTDLEFSVYKLGVSMLHTRRTLNKILLRAGGETFEKLFYGIKEADS